jgi:hypothetical protein
LGLFLLVLGTAGAVWTLLARNPVVARSSHVVARSPDLATPGGVSEPRGFRPKPWWTLAVLGLAATAFVLSNVMLSTPLALLGLVLLLLGIGAGVYGYLFDGRAECPGQRALLRISPRGWVSLSLLVLATGVEALELTRAWTNGEASNAQQVAEATPEKNLAEARAALAKIEAELRSSKTKPTEGRSWDDLRGSDGAGTPAGGGNGDARKLENDLDDLRLKLARLEADPNGSLPALPPPTVSSVDLATWRWRPGPGRSDDRAAADRARQTMLEGEVAQLRAKVTRIEAESNKPKAAPSPAGPLNVDLSTWTWNARGGRPDTSVADQDHLQPAFSGWNRVRQ